MRRGRVTLGGLSLAACGLAAGVFLGSTIASGQEGMDEAAMMQKWMAYGTPGPEHERLATMVGAWDVAGTSWQYPGAEPQKSTMKAKVSPILEGRYFVEEVEGSFEMDGQKMPFQGRNLFGFDNLKQKHFFVWCDTWMTGFITGEGVASKNGKTITFMSENWPNPMTGGFDHAKLVSERVSDDKHIDSFYKRGPDGEWFKEMELVYTR
jgi:hypothetical protein